jgi:hypothetical protein
MLVRLLEQSLLDWVHLEQRIEGRREPMGRLGRRSYREKQSPWSRCRAEQGSWSLLARRK